MSIAFRSEYRVRSEVWVETIKRERQKFSLSKQNFTKRVKNMINELMSFLVHSCSAENFFHHISHQSKARIWKISKFRLLQLDDVSERRFSNWICHEYKATDEKIHKMCVKSNFLLFFLTRLKFEFHFILFSSKEMF